MKPQGEVQDGGRELASMFEQAVESGEHRLKRTTPALLATGAVGGLDVGLGIFGFLIVMATTGNEMLAALAFSSGFIALVLANSELFTENFLLPIVAVSMRRATWPSVLRLWGGTLVTNLLGGWIITGLIVSGFPEIREQMLVMAAALHEDGIGWTSFASGVFAGTLMTLMTWIERGTPSIAARIVAAVVVGFLLAAGHAHHAILLALESFGALQVGAPFGYGATFALVGWAIVANAVGGIVLVTSLRLVQISGATRAQVRARLDDDR